MSHATRRPTARVFGPAALLCTATLLLAHQNPAPQQPTFRAGTDVSLMTVRVLDRERRPVRGLTAADFTIEINGVLQPIVDVSGEDLAGPIAPSAPWMRDVAPDVASNSLANPRLIVIILDDALFSAGNAAGYGLPHGSPAGDPWVLRHTKLIARAIIDELGPSDLASVVFSLDNRAPQDFSNDRTRLLAAVERFHETGVSPQLAGMYSIQTLMRAIEFLRNVPERSSAVMWVSIGLNLGEKGIAPKMISLDTSMAEHVSEVGLQDALAGLVGEAHIASVPVYPISPLGLLAPTPAYATMHQPSRARSDSMRAVARSTGGRAIVDTNAPRDDVPAIFRENSFHYVVGYRMTNPVADGKHRRLKVRVNRPGVIVEPSDRLFFAPDAKAVAAASRKAVPPPTTRALSGIIPVIDEPLQLAVAPFAAPVEVPRNGAPAAVTVVLGLDVPFTSEEASAGDTVALESRVFDGEGRKEIEVHRTTATLAPKPGRTRGQYELLSTLSLKPGRYNLRFSTYSEARNKSGSVYTDVTIPDFAKAALSLSGVVVGVVPARSAAPADAFAGLLPLVPTTTREFGTSEQATAFLRVYWGGDKPAVPVVMRAEVIDTQNAVVYERSDTLISTPARANSLRSADYRVELPLDRLAPGEYVLTLRATQPKAPEIRRDVRFHVR